MKAMILAAGRGERMRPLTDTTPKPLLNIGSQPLIEYHLKSLAKAGIKDVVINTCYLANKIEDSLGDGSCFGVSITYSREDKLLDTGGGIVNALKYLGDQPFIVISADVFTNIPLELLPKNPKKLAHLVMVENPDYHLEGDFVLDSYSGEIKIANGSTYTYSCIGVFRPEFFAGAPTGPFPIRDILRMHVADNMVTGEYYNGLWYNVGKPEDLEMVNALV